MWYTVRRYILKLFCGWLLGTQIHGYFCRCSLTMIRSILLDCTPPRGLPSPFSLSWAVTDRLQQPDLWPWPPEVHTLSRANANGLGHTGPCDRMGSSWAISWCLLRLISDSRLRGSAPRATGARRQRYSIEGVDEPTQPTCSKSFKDRAGWGGNNRTSLCFLCFLTFSLTRTYLGICLDCA